MVRILALLFGAAFIFAGLVGHGYMPQYTQNGLLFGYFEIGTIYSLVQLVTGVAAVIAAFSRPLSKTFFIVFGLLYGAAAGVGFWREGDIYLMQLNMADVCLYAGLAVLALLIGFMSNSD